MDISIYLSLITSRHVNKPRFRALLSILVQHSVDCQNVLATFPSLFDVTKAIGDQQDILGKWVGVSRRLLVPLEGIFFSFGVAGLGWGQGILAGTVTDSGTLVSLPDEVYRNLLLAKIASNHWDGTIPGAYTVLSTLFATAGFEILIQDNQDMTISIIFLGPNLDAVSSQMLRNGLLALRPSGVDIKGYFKAVEPVFGFGRQDTIVSGWGSGNFIQLTTF